MDNGPFMDGLPVYRLPIINMWFSIVILDYKRVDHISKDLTSACFCHGGFDGVHSSQTTWPAERTPGCTLEEPLKHLASCEPPTAVVAACCKELSECFWAAIVMLHFGVTLEDEMEMLSLKMINYINDHERESLWKLPLCTTRTIIFQESGVHFCRAPLGFASGNWGMPLPVSKRFWEGCPPGLSGCQPVIESPSYQ